MTKLKMQTFLEAASAGKLTKTDEIEQVPNKTHSKQNDSNVKKTRVETTVKK
jgi:hypothetical protein